MKFLVSLGLLFFLSSMRLFAWSGPGHMIVAAIAYRDLSPEDRAKAQAILEHHDNFEKWKAEVPEKSGTLDEGIISFMGAAKWPDEIKFGHSPWNHNEWHYVDYPVTPPNFVFKPSPAPDNDIIFAINHCVEKLKNHDVTLEGQARWLSWLIQLTGDITQPLHCCALVNDDFHAPIGDRGGNLIFVKASLNSRGIPLHKMLDDALGTSQGFHAKLLRTYANKAIALGSEYKRESLPDLALHGTPTQWARESWEVGVRDVYLRGALQYGKDSETAALLPEGYTKKLKAMATERLTLGGYRLADLIREALR
jgi:S1/P1 Nuclease